MYEIEQFLPFLKYDAEVATNLPFEVQTIKKSGDGKYYEVSIALKRGKQVKILGPSTKTIKIENVEKAKNVLKLQYIKENKVTNTIVEDKISLGPGNIWSIQNAGGTPLYINFVFAK
jgi:hypothetical protein